MKKKIIITIFVGVIIMLLSQQLIQCYDCSFPNRVIANFYYKRKHFGGEKNELTPHPKWEMDIDFDNYYLLTCFRDNKGYLKVMDSLRHVIWARDIKKEYILMSDSLARGNILRPDSSNYYNSSLSFIKDTDNFGTSWKTESRDLEYIHNILVVSSFKPIEPNGKKLKEVYFDPIETKIKITHRELKGANAINLYFDYDDLDKATLQRIYNTIKEMNYQKQNKEFTYYIYNNYEDKQVDVYIKYGDFGKWFEWKIM